MSFKNSILIPANYLIQAFVKYVIVSQSNDNFLQNWYQTAIEGLKMVVVQVQQDIKQHSRAQKAISANQRAQNVRTLPKSRHSIFHFITIQIRALFAEQYENYSSRIFYKVMRQS